MIELRWSPQSFQDLAAIRAYVADDSPVYAELTVQRIVAAVERLRIFPDSGRMVPERQSPELRELIVGVILPRVGGAGRRGIEWHHASPPVVGNELEIDVRGTRVELVADV